MPNEKKTPPREVDVMHFVMKNEAFFRMPLTNQEDFQAFYKQQLTAIEDYSQKFLAVLNKALLSNKNYRGPALIWWQKGEFQKVIAIPEVREFLMSNAEHAALIFWQQAHPPRDIPPPRAYSEEEIASLKELIGELSKRLEDAQKEILKYIGQLTPKKNTPQILNDIQCLKGANNGITACLGKLKAANKELSGENGRPLPSEIASHLRFIDNELNTTVKSNLLNVVDQPIRGWGEIFLNALAKLFRFEGYKSDETIQTENRTITLSKLGQQLPATLQNALLTVGLFKEINKNKSSSEEDLLNSDKLMKDKI